MISGVVVAGVLGFAFTRRCFFLCGADAASVPPDRTNGNGRRRSGLGGTKISKDQARNAAAELAGRRDKHLAAADTLA